MIISNHHHHHYYVAVVTFLLMCSLTQSFTMIIFVYILLKRLFYICKQVLINTICVSVFQIIPSAHSTTGVMAVSCYLYFHIWGVYQVLLVKCFIRQYDQHLCSLKFSMTISALLVYISAVSVHGSISGQSNIIII